MELTCTTSSDVPLACQFTSTYVAELPVRSAVFGSNSTGPLAPREADRCVRARVRRLEGAQFPAQVTAHEEEARTVILIRFEKEVLDRESRLS